MATKSEVFDGYVEESCPYCYCRELEHYSTTFEKGGESGTILCIHFSCNGCGNYLRKKFDIKYLYTTTEVFFKEDEPKSK